MSKDRPGSWNVLVVTIAIAYASAKWISRWCGACVSPVMILTSFLTTHYAREIETSARWIRIQLHCLKCRLFGSRPRAEGVAT
jgi:hypothetical protein